MKDLSIAIEHVGSTSVKGLAAKPIIEIDIVIENRSMLEPVMIALAQIGKHKVYLGVDGREAFTYKGKEHLQTHRLYVCTKDCEE